MKTPRTPVAAAPTDQDLALYMPLVHQIAGRILARLPRHVLAADLIAAGTFGLLDALRKNPARTGAFEWYARVRIRGAIMDELRALDWQPRRSRERMERFAARGEAGRMSVVGFDDLSEREASALSDDASPCPLEQLGRCRDRAALRAAFARLPEREANVLTWHYFEEAPVKDIAARLGVTSARVSQIHKRATERLREVMAGGQEQDAA